MIAVVLIGGYFLFQVDIWNNGEDENTKVNQETGQVVSEESHSEDKLEEVIFTMSEVQMHNSKESCYTVIDRKVYDLTAWIPQHPGGEANILKLCGIDGTGLFRGQHDNNPKQENILKGFYIGDLKN